MASIQELQEAIQADKEYRMPFEFVGIRRKHGTVNEVCSTCSTYHPTGLPLQPSSMLTHYEKEDLS